MNLYTNLTQRDYSIIKNLESGNANSKRYADILKLVIADNDFQKLVQKIREILGVPKDGLDLREKEQKKIFFNYVRPAKIVRDVFCSQNIYLGENTTNEIISFFNSKNWYGSEKKYYNDDLHEINLMIPVSSYILAGYFDLMGCEMISVIIPEYSGIPEITIQASPFVTKNEMIDFINDNWDNFNFIKENFIGKDFGKRNKVKKNFLRDVFIVSKFNEIKKTGCKYPEIKLTKWLREKMNIHLSEGTIRVIVNRINKFVSNKEG